jgi:hypothetical protein
MHQARKIFDPFSPTRKFSLPITLPPPTQKETKSLLSLALPDLPVRFV